MKKFLVFAVAILTAATIFAQEKKAVIGVAELTTTLSEATVDGYWGEYWGSPDSKDASDYTHMKTEINTKLMRNAEAPAKLAQVKFTLQNMLFDYFADSDLFEEIVECNANGSDAGDIDYLVQTSLDLLYLNRDTYQDGSEMHVDSYALIGVTVNLKDIKNNTTYLPIIFYVGCDYKNRNNHNKLFESLRKGKENDDYVDGMHYYPHNTQLNHFIRNIDLINPESSAAPSGGFLTKAIHASIAKEKVKDDFLYKNPIHLSGLEDLVKNIITIVYHKINPPKIRTVDENGIITFSALGLAEKDMLDVMDGGKSVAEIYIYEIKDRIAYAKVDPNDPEYADAKIQEGFCILPPKREVNWRQVSNAIKNIKKDVKTIKKAQKANAKAKK